ncbi:F-box domain-containing protein [Mycena sanguinolenta]|uniref:F-box domain-containing protein n=1 Tax=Mycena sanguinolenta TaxID=230812 RepID=A0A8H6ZH39_9AGAR|nr:F-box domain-containing protein [Mycena sanguinolenta]
MSVEELRTRIVQLDSEIERQRKLLKKLEKDKSLVQRQLNAVLDPVARLPVEISSEIFLQSRAAEFTGPRHVPIVLLRICKAWTQIALATPALWTTVHIRFPCSKNLAHVLPLWFQRARNRPLCLWISLHGSSSNWDHRVSNVLWKHGGQLKHLEILDDDDLGDRDDRTLDLFRGTASTLGSLPLLETFKIRCEHRRRRYRASQILQLLRQAPNIVESIFHNIATLNDPAPENLVIPTLRRLILGVNTGDDGIIRYLSLPALETLSLPLSTITGDDLLVFLERSGAPLQDLALGWEFDEHAASIELHDCLHLVPSITRFRMWQPHTNIVSDFFAALADSPSLLPNLHDLTIHLYHADRDPPDLSEPFWRTLIRALSTRHIEQLSIVPVMLAPPTEVLASLRELVADGAEMYIGTEALNFVHA